jgi:hypothetical protein
VKRCALRRRKRQPPARGPWEAPARQARRNPAGGTSALRASPAAVIRDSLGAASLPLDRPTAPPGQCRNRCRPRWQRQQSSSIPSRRSRPSRAWVRWCMISVAGPPPWSTSGVPHEPRHLGQRLSTRLPDRVEAFARSLTRAERGHPTRARLHDHDREVVRDDVRALTRDPGALALHRPVRECDLLGAQLCPRCASRLTGEPRRRTRWPAQNGTRVGNRMLAFGNSENPPQPASRRSPRRPRSRPAPATRTPRSRN